MESNVEPIFITDKKTGTKYTLDFNRESVTLAERQGFKVSEQTAYPRTYLEDLFYHSFRMHQPTISKQKTNALLVRMGGLTEAVIDRLGLLYAQAMTANLIKTDDEGYEKNAEVAVEM